MEELIAIVLFCALYSLLSLIMLTVIQDMSKLFKLYVIVIAPLVLVGSVCLIRFGVI